MKSVWYYNYIFGTIWISEKNGAITYVLFNGDDKRISGYHAKETPLIKKAATQLAEYLNGTRKEFDLPLSLHGSKFQQMVWKALQTIP